MGLKRAGIRELREIEGEIARQRGGHERSSLSYIASVLQDAGASVDYHDRFLDPAIEEPYASRLQGKLEFRDLASAKRSITALDAVYREYREAADRQGTSLVRELVMKGMQRAESLAGNPRVGIDKRQEKKEIAEWFRVWLEVPDLFFDWVELRQETGDFQRRFAEHEGNGNRNGSH